MLQQNEINTPQTQETRNTEAKSSMEYSNKILVSDGLQRDQSLEENQERDPLLEEEDEEEEDDDLSVSKN